MPIAVDPQKPFDFILSCDRDEAGAPKDDASAESISERRVTRFKLKPLTVQEATSVEDGVAAWDTASGKVDVRQGTQTLTILRLGLVGWEDFYDAAGNPVPFTVANNGKTKGQVTNATLDRLAPSWRREIAEAIMEQTRLTEDERGN